MVDQDLGIASSSPFVWLLRPMLVPVLGLSLFMPTRYPACPRLESELQRQNVWWPTPTPVRRRDSYCRPNLTRGDVHSGAVPIPQSLLRSVANTALGALNTAGPR